MKNSIKFITPNEATILGYFNTASVVRIKKKLNQLYDKLGENARIAADSVLKRRGIKKS